MVVYFPYIANKCIPDSHKSNWSIMHQNCLSSSWSTSLSGNLVGLKIQHGVVSVHGVLSTVQQLSCLTTSFSCCPWSTSWCWALFSWLYWEWIRHRGLRSSIHTVSYIFRIKFRAPENENHLLWNLIERNLCVKRSSKHEVCHETH